MLRHELELLSPARSADIGIEAVNHGADAVYIGGPDWGARASAGNSVADIARLVAHAHRFHSRIFVTLNTILREDELESARRLVWQLHDAGVDALIVQDMGLLELDLPPIQLHASTQTDIRTPEKARFLQDAGFSQMVLARELALPEIRAIADQVQEATLEFFVHGALCVAYSGQCYISHAHTGRSANRGDCSQACRLPYTVTDGQNRIVAHEQHVLSLKDNNQSANLAALVDAGIRSFKIEGRYKDMGYVKNLTAHYRLLLDELLEQRPELARASAGRCSYTFTPDPDRNFNRGSTDYFVNGRQDDIGAFDSPKHAGLPLGWVTKVTAEHVEVALDEGVAALNNNDALTYYDLQKELVGLPIDTARCVDAGKRLWQIVPKEAITSYKDLRRDTFLSRNRDMAWDRLLDKKSAERRVGLWLKLSDTPDGLALTATDEAGVEVTATLPTPKAPPKDAARAEATLREQLGKLGGTIYALEDLADLTIATAQPWFVPASTLNTLRRAAIDALDAARLAAHERPARAAPIEPPAPYPEDGLSYLANVYNQKARDFYARHGVKVIEAAYESHEALGEVSLMITKHCVRFSLSLCPKQAKGVTGVQGTVKAEPLTLVNGSEKLTLRFDCKPCEMHVVGRMKKTVLNQSRREEQQRLAEGVPMQFYRTRPAPRVAG
ncbi:MAG TPA: U32 family peptidase [Burkholderiaceae bacterium]|nr:U32 family peptidase [Burkholderiaceae bacterium]HMX09653.1 U32 family peptidase [Burkholderiaceae bacterium]HMY99731.1 U32 family peptidase [Burkholderiaceae bacterium]